MAERGRRPLARRALWLLFGAVVLIGVGALVWRDEIGRALLDPGVPYQIYNPPPAPDYSRRSAWALLPDGPARASTGADADIFFVHSATYKGGRHWNAPIGLPEADAQLQRVVIPNYAGPFQSVGRVFAPRYRQASEYALSTLRDDAREARRFPLQDVRAALDAYRQKWGGDRPLILVGVGQGGELLGRVAAEAAADPAFRRRLVAVYLIHTLVPADEHGPGALLPACERRAQAGCLVSWKQAPRGGAAGARTLLDRTLVWNAEGQLTNLGGRPALCVNPLTGTRGGAATERENLGAANATGLEWGARPAFLPRQVSAECQGGLLQVSEPHSRAFHLPGDPMERRRAPPFNLFYADLEADARARLTAWRGGTPAPPISQTIEVKPAPVHRID